MLPRPKETFGVPSDIGEYGDWTTFPTYAMFQMLSEGVANEGVRHPAEKRTMRRWGEAQLADVIRKYQGPDDVIDKEYARFRVGISKFLTAKEADYTILAELEQHLAALANIYGQVTTEKQVFTYCLSHTLGNWGMGHLKSIWNVVSQGEVTDKDRARDMSYRELMLVDVILRQIANFGLWRAIELSKQSYRVAEEDGNLGRAFVGAVALDYEGQILATGYRGDHSAVPSMHAENIMLNKLRDRKQLEDVAVVSVSLEPCLDRSPRHHEHLGHGLGCSQLLIDANIPVIAYILPDYNKKGKGRGGPLLRDNGKVVFVADHPSAISTLSNMQTLPHLRDFRDGILPHDAVG